MAGKKPNDQLKIMTDQIAELRIRAEYYELKARIIEARKIVDAEISKK